MRRNEHEKTDWKSIQLGSARTFASDRSAGRSGAVRRVRSLVRSGPRAAQIQQRIIPYMQDQAPDISFYTVLKIFSKS